MAVSTARQLRDGFSNFFDGAFERPDEIDFSRRHTLGVIAMKDLNGQTLGQCQIDCRLGQGGMGVVYRGRHLALDIEVAIKVLPQYLADNAEYVGRFYREAREAAKLDHPNIVRVINVGEENGLHFIVMQFIDGPSLRDVLKSSGPLEPPMAVGAVMQTLAGLDYAHRRGLVHRDIKPDNLMLTSEGVVKITDFGLARGANAGDSQLTRTGEVMGTPVYMPMEQWDGAIVDHRADLYALGVSLYQLLSGKVPFTGDQPTVIVRQLALGEIVPLSSARAGLDPKLIAIVEHMMARDREARYQTAAEAMQALTGWQQSAGIDPMATGTAPHTLLAIPMVSKPAMTVPANSTSAAAPTMTMAPGHEDDDLVPTIVTPPGRVHSTAPVAVKVTPKKKSDTASGRAAPTTVATADRRQPIAADFASENASSSADPKPQKTKRKKPASAASGRKKSTAAKVPEPAPPVRQGPPMKWMAMAAGSVLALLVVGAAIAASQPETPVPTRLDLSGSVVESTPGSAGNLSASAGQPPIAPAENASTGTTTSGTTSTNPDSPTPGSTAAEDALAKQRMIRADELRTYAERLAKAVEGNKPEGVLELMDATVIDAKLREKHGEAPQKLMWGLAQIKLSIALAIGAIEVCELRRVEIAPSNLDWGVAIYRVRYVRNLPKQAETIEIKWYFREDAPGTGIGRWYMHFEDPTNTEDVPPPDLPDDRHRDGFWRPPPGDRPNNPPFERPRDFDGPRREDGPSRGGFGPSSDGRNGR